MAYKFKQIDEAPLTIGERWCESWLVSYPVSYRYNGGITVDGEWYDGFEVATPEVPEGFELVSICCGLQLNAQPPHATHYLKPIDGRKVKMNDLKASLTTRKEQT